MNVVASNRFYGDQRREVRRRVHYPAFVERGDGRPPLDCTILDISALGARLSVSANAKIPDRFTLLLSKIASGCRHCRVVWRSKLLIGVEFVAAPDAVVEPIPAEVLNTAELDC